MTREFKISHQWTTSTDKGPQIQKTCKHWAIKAVSCVICRGFLYHLLVLVWTPNSFIAENIPKQKRMPLDHRAQNPRLSTLHAKPSWGRAELPHNSLLLWLSQWGCLPLASLSHGSAFPEPWARRALETGKSSSTERPCKIVHGKSWETLACFWSGHNENKWGLQFKVVTKNLFFPAF